MPFPIQGQEFPTKDEMADYLEAYAERFELPVRKRGYGRLPVAARRALRRDGRHPAAEADHVVVAMTNYQQPYIPAFAEELDISIVQLHSSAYRNLSQLHEGGVLIVGAGNSGSEIAMEVVRHHPGGYQGEMWVMSPSISRVPQRSCSCDLSFASFSTAC